MNKENNEFVDFILDTFHGARRDRALKLATGQIKSTDPEFKKFIMNELVIIRRSIIKQYKKVEWLAEYRKEYSKRYKQFEKAGDIVEAAETHIKIAEINGYIKEIEGLIASYGSYVSDVLRFDLLTEHEACQLFNINYKTFQDEKKNYLAIEKKANGNNGHLVYSVIAVCAPEYRHRKGRAKEWIDCPNSEVPIYWAMHEHIKQEMKDNEEFKAATNKAFKECFPGLKTYRAVKDLEGNVVKVIEDKKEE